MFITIDTPCDDLLHLKIAQGTGDVSVYETCACVIHTNLLATCAFNSIVILMFAWGTCAS